MQSTIPTVEEIFFAALELESSEARASFLDRHCGDPAIRRRVEELLSVDAQGAEFLESPAAIATMTTDPGSLPIAEASGTVIGPYRLVEPIGEGGMGVVYLAEQVEPVRRRVALKVIKPGMDSKQVIARFEAERQALAMMDHPNIARVFDGGMTPSGRPYFVMELVLGIPITEYCDREHLTIAERLELFVLVCRAVQHAHQKGIIHRDLKPSNVLVTALDGAAVPKVIDFGVAKATGQALTEKTLLTGFHQFVGTPLYMSPEQAEISGSYVDTRSDIYSLGVVLYELLTGTTPFDQETLRGAAFDEVRRIIREQEPPTPSTRLRELGTTLSKTALNRREETRTLLHVVRGELDWIIMKALEKDRTRRYETANGFAADLTRYLSDEPLSVGPPSAGYRLRKFARRNRRALALAMLLAVATLVALGAVAASVGWIMHDRATRRAAVEQQAALAFDEAEGWIEQENWQKAKQAIQRGAGILAGGGREGIRDRMSRQDRHVSMMLRLEEIDYLAMELQRNWHEWDVLHDGYARAFVDFGVDVVSLPVEEAAARLRSEGRITAPLVRALDTWASLVSPKTRECKPKLRAVAGLIDDDHWRRRVREALERRDGESLAELAGSPDLDRQSRDNLAFLEFSLDDMCRPDLALAVRRLLQRNHPGNFMATYWLAHRLFWSSPSDPAEVVSFARAAVALRPRAAAAQLLLAIALQRAGKLDESLHHHDKAIELAPENPYAYHDRGWTLHLMGRYEEAVASNRKAIDLWDRDHFAYGNMARSLKALNRKPESLAASRKAAEFHPDPLQVLFETANSLRDERRLDEAIDVLNEIIARNPNSAEAYHILGRTLSSQRKFDEAIANYTKAIELEPKNGWAHLSLGLTRTAQGQTAEADAHYRRAIELDPTIPHFHFYLGWNWHLRGDDAEAVLCFRAATRLARNPAVPFHSNLNRLFNERARRLANDPNAEARRPRLAVELAEEAVRLNPAIGANWNTLGVAHYRSGDWKSAVQALNTSMERLAGFDEGSNLFFLALATWQMGNQGEARKYYDRAVAWTDANRPRDPDLIRFRAEASELLRVGGQGKPELAPASRVER